MDWQYTTRARALIAPDMALIPTCDPSSQDRCVVTRAPRELRFSIEPKSVRRGSRIGKIDTRRRVAVRGCFRPSNITTSFWPGSYLRVKTTSFRHGPVIVNQVETCDPIQAGYLAQGVIASTAIRLLDTSIVPMTFTLWFTK